MKLPSFLESYTKEDVQFSSLSMSIDSKKNNYKQSNNYKPKADNNKQQTSDDFMVVKQNGDMVSSSIEYSLTDSSQYKQVRINHFRVIV